MENLYKLITLIVVIIVVIVAIVPRTIKFINKKIWKKDMK